MIGTNLHCSCTGGKLSVTRKFFPEQGSGAAASEY